MNKRKSPPDSSQVPPPDLNAEQLIRALIQQGDAEAARAVLDEANKVLAKLCPTLRKQGRRSVGRQCFQAIVDGHVALGLPLIDPDLDPDSFEGTEDSGDPFGDHTEPSADDWVIMLPRPGYESRPYEQLSLGRLKKMIREPVPSVKPSTARKYARLYRQWFQFRPRS